MDSNNRWHYNPFDQVKPLRQQKNDQQEQDLSRSQSLNELRQHRPVSIIYIRLIVLFINSHFRFLFLVDHLLIVYVRMFHIPSYINFVLMNYLIFGTGKE